MGKTFKSALVIMLSLTMVASFAGCGSKADFDTTTLTIGLTSTVDTMNPLTSYEQTSAEIFSLIYDPLVRFDKDQKSIPCLAKSWDLSKDNLTWIFHLQEGVKWHDGKPFTSADVKYTYDIMMDTELGGMYVPFLEGITSITCPDANTVVIKTNKPKANMLMNTTPILPEHIWSSMSKTEVAKYANAEAIGTGPYKFDSMKNGYIKVTANEDYFGGAPKVKNYVFNEYKNTDSLAQALKLGEVDAAINLSATQMPQLEKDDNISIISGQQLGFMQVGINCDQSSKSKGNPLLKDKEIRKAIECAIDKQQIIDMAYGGQGEEGTTLINKGNKYHYEPTAAESRKYNADKAKSILDAAGYKDTNNDGVREDKNGNKLSFEFINIADNSDEVKTGQLIAATCKKVGIEINCVTMDSGALQDKINASDYDMFMWGWGADIDPTTILGLLTTAQIGANNEPKWSNAEYDKDFVLQQQQLDEKERIATVKNMQKTAYDDAPYIILVYDNSVQAIRKDRWKGFTQVPEFGSYFYNQTDYNYVNMQPIL